MLKSKKIKYTIYDEYFVTEKFIEDFNKQYYVNFIGTINIKKFKNNEIKQDLEVKKCLSGYNCEFYRLRKRYLLKIGKNIFYFKRNEERDKVFDKFFIVKKRDYFEFNYRDIPYIDNKFIEKNEYNLYIKNKDENESLEQYENYIKEKIISLEQYEDYVIKQKIKNFNIEDYFKYMTKNQLIILALFLLGLSNKAISLLLKTSSTYIFLEKIRIIKKIKSLVFGGKNGIK